MEPITAKQFLITRVIEEVRQSKSISPLLR